MPDHPAKPDWVELQRQVGEARGGFIPAHSSGHIHVTDLIGLVNALKAKAVIPVHTFEPQMFREHFPNAVLLVDGQPLHIGD